MQHVKTHTSWQKPCGMSFAMPWPFSWGYSKTHGSHTLQWCEFCHAITRSSRSNDAPVLITESIYIKVTLVTFVYLFSTVSFQMRPQMTCPTRGKVTLVAFVLLFSSLGFHLCLQIACMRRSMVKLVAFVWFFSGVHFHMSPQTECMRRGIVTLVAFIWLFSTVRFQMCP